MDVLPILCETVAVYLLILIFIIVENRKYPPSIERVKGKANNSEDYIVSVLRFTRGWGMRYSEYCFYKGKDGKYRLKTSVIGMIFSVFSFGVFLLYWIGIIKSDWNMILRNPKMFIPGYLGIFFLLVVILMVPNTSRIIARIYFYKYMKKHRKNKRS